VTLKLVQGGTISGKVVDGADQPIASANVYFWSQESSGWRRNVNETTGLDGTFTLKGLPSGRSTMGASGPRGGSWKQITLDPPLTAAEVRKDVVVKLDQGTATVTGVVVDEAGKPVGGKQVSANGKNGNGSGWATTRGDGTFTIESLPVADVTIAVQETDDSGNSYRGASGSPVTTKAPATNVRLTYVATKKTTVFGRVVDPTGNPVALCSVRVVPATVPGGDASYSSRSWGQNPDEVVSGEFRRSVGGTPPSR